MKFRLGSLGAVFAFLAVLGFVSAAGADEVDFREPVVVPRPQKLAYDAKVAVRLDGGLRVTVDCPDDAAVQWTTTRLADWFGIRPAVVAARTAEPDAADEGYRLTAEPGALTVRARSLQGVRYALYTLRQAAEPMPVGDRVQGWWLPKLTVEDRPALRFRGVHLCWFADLPKGLVERQIRLAAYYKFNYAVVESWGVFRCERHPYLSVADAPLDAAEARRLAALGRDLGITLVPQMNVLGHAAMARSCAGRHVALDAHPERAPLFEPDGGWNWCLSNPDARRVVCEHVAELHEAFGNPPYFHIGCDEADRPSCPRCRAAASYGALEEEHIRAVHDLLAARGARTMMWFDMLLDGWDPKWTGFYAHGHADEAAMFGRLPKDIVICDWFYGKGRETYPTLDHFRTNGFDTVTSPWKDLGGVDAQFAHARKTALFGGLQTIWHHFRGQEFGDMMGHAAQGGWGEGTMPKPGWMSPFSAHWRQVGQDMGVRDRADQGFYRTEVTREILDL